MTDLPTREELLAVMGAATRAGDAQGMHDALALLALVSPTDAEAILAVIEARSAELEQAKIEVEPGGPCTSCKEPIELGYLVVDEDGYRFCEGCWQP